MSSAMLFCGLVAPHECFHFQFVVVAPEGAMIFVDVEAIDTIRIAESSISLTLIRASQALSMTCIML